MPCWTSTQYFLVLGKLLLLLLLHFINLAFCTGRSYSNFLPIKQVIASDQRFKLLKTLWPLFMDGVQPWSHPVVLNTGPLDWESRLGNPRLAGEHLGLLSIFLFSKKLSYTLTYFSFSPVQFLEQIPSPSPFAIFYQITPTPFPQILSAI